MEQMESGWGPNFTPKIIKWLIILTAFISLCASLLNPLFTELWQTVGPQYLLSLSWYGIKQYYLWQPLSHLFLQDGAEEGIGTFLLITLTFNMYILWVFGSMLVEKVRSRSFIFLYLGCGALAGLTTLLMQFLTRTPIVLAGPAASLLALFTSWTLFYPHSELRLFFAIPLNPKRLLVTIIGFICFIHLIQLDFVGLVHPLLGILYGYLFSGLVFGLCSPYVQLESLDRLLEKGHEKFFRQTASDSSAKIVSLKGEPLLNDEEFIDEMLTKIAKYGENSLSSTEKRRMDEIAKRKMKPRDL